MSYFEIASTAHYDTTFGTYGRSALRTERQPQPTPHERRPAMRW